MANVLVVFLLAAIVAAAYSVQFDTANIPSAELNALYALYNSTNGNDWNWDGVLGQWDFTDDPKPCNDPTWQGITCTTVNNQYFIEQIALSKYNLDGTLPHSLGDFTYLTLIDFSFNAINGSIPVSLYSNTLLTELSLNTNGITGTISPLLGNLESLTVFQVHYNMLNGSIPSTLGGLVGLQQFNAFRNYLTGTIPENIGNWTQLQTFQLDDNLLNGTIPFTITLLTELTELALDGNFLYGSIPEDIGSLVLLTKLTLGGNLLNGTIPRGIGSLAVLTDLSLFSNLLTGVIPEEIGELTLLDLLYLDGNLLKGTIPANIFNLSLLELDLSVNQLSGSLPDNFGNLHRVAEVRLLHNNLTGTIPDSVVHMDILESLELDYNQINGSLPSALGYVPHLIVLNVQSNQITGYLPLSLFSSPTLGILFFSYNRFEGSIPENITADCNIFGMELDGNLFTGSVPASIANCSNLNSITLSYNYFSQSIPPDVFEIPDLIQVSFDNNDFTGTIPSSVCNDNRLEYLNLEFNQLHGPIPSHCNFSFLLDMDLQSNMLTGFLPDWDVRSLRTVVTDTNYLEGNFFDWLYDCRRLNYMIGSNNLFTGSISTEVSNFEELSEIQMYNNFMTGSLPIEMSSLRLKSFLAYNNQLTGPLENMLNITSRIDFLTHLDVSANQLTGTIPSTIFQFRRLEVFAASVNCLHGSIPDTVCDPQLLRVLALDGLSTATSCQNRFFPHNSNHKAYYLTKFITGGVPECLFSQPILETLHLSGNGLTGSLPGDMVLSDSLNDLSLSHNVLTGTIPLQLQQKQWSNLDLSYNKFTGVLSGDFAYQSSNTSVSVEVNRLSGGIPGALKNLDNIDMLNGNMYSCNRERNDLPSHDPEYQTYSCGSYTLENSLFVYMALAGVALLVIGWTVRRSAETMHRLSKWLDAIRTDALFEGYCIQMKELRTYFGLLAALGCLVLLPTYIAVSHYYSMYTHSYIWSLSAAYVFGFNSALILLLVWLAVCIVIVWWTHRLIRTFQITSKLDSDQSEEEPKANFCSSWSSFAVSSVVILLNAVFVTLVNVLYVYVIHNYSPVQVFLMQVFMVMFKLTWNGAVVWQSLNWVNKRISVSSHLVALRLVLFNNLVAPFIATAFISSDCFYNVIETPNSVTNSFEYEACLNFQIYNENTPCAELITTDAVTSYVPPFIYSYQCASTYIAAYTDVFVYMYLTIAVLYPLFQVIIWWLVGVMKDKNELVVKMLNSMQWRLLDVSSGNDGKLISSEQELFSVDVFVVEVVSAIGILMIFGVVFPPLAVIIFISVVVRTLSTEVLIGRLLTRHKTEEEVRTRLVREFSQLSRFQDALIVVVPVTAAFYAFMLFDTLGDEVGWSVALWLPFSVLGMAALILIGGWAFVYWESEKARKAFAERKSHAVENSNL